MHIRVLPLIIIACTSLLTTKMLYLLPQKNDNNTLNLTLISELNAKPQGEENISDVIEEKVRAKIPEKEIIADLTKKERDEYYRIRDKIRREAAAPKPYENRSFTKSDLDILESLSKRRKTLEQWENDLMLKENLLKATELRIDAKIAELKSLKTEVQQLIKAYQKEDSEKIRTLVKIYENMKPKEAAKILEQLEMKVLLQVVNSMREAKAAPILAKMSPEYAKDITVEIAKQKKLRHLNNRKN